MTTFILNCKIKSNLKIKLISKLNDLRGNGGIKGGMGEIKWELINIYKY
jgi:hypothetical protein